MFEQWTGRNPYGGSSRAQGRIFLFPRVLCVEISPEHHWAAEAPLRDRLLPGQAESKGPEGLPHRVCGSQIREGGGQ